MKMRSLIGFALASAVFASPLAQAQQKPDDVIKFRKGLMQVQGHSARPLGQMAKGEIPFDRDLVIRNAAMLELTGRMIVEGFPSGTEKGASESTRARPEVWSDSAKFRQNADQFQQAAVKLTEAAKTGTLESMRPAFAAVAKQCSACHDGFRVK
jgi:cytochrome c556